jgi:hypothetical protein
MTKTEVIAQRGASVLVRSDDDRARILDMRHGRLFPAQSIESALARGYWEEFTGDIRDVESALAAAEEITADPPSQSLATLAHDESLVA